MRTLGQSLIETLRLRAKRRLPPAIFHYVDGGADDEWSMAENRAAFGQYQLLPKALGGGGGPDASTRVLGCDLELPLMLAPAAGLQLLHPDKELAVSRASARAGLAYVAAMLSNTPISALTRANPQSVAQVYLHRDPALNDLFVDLCAASGCRALCITVDAFVPGNRERDLATRLKMPLRLTRRNIWDFVTHLPWVMDQRRAGPFVYCNLGPQAQAPASVAEYIATALNPSPSWDDVARVRDRWRGPFAVKGILTAADARIAAQLGATAIFVSNHGGRQLDGVPAPISQVREIREAVGPKVELIVDGGVRRGTDILKAIALGADACSIGRPYLFALAAGGEAGLDLLLQAFRSEILRGLALLGCRDLGDLGPERVTWSGADRSTARPDERLDGVAMLRSGSRK